MTRRVQSDELIINPKRLKEVVHELFDMIERKKYLTRREEIRLYILCSVATGLTVSRFEKMVKEMKAAKGGRKELGKIMDRTMEQYSSFNERARRSLYGKPKLQM